MQLTLFTGNGITYDEAANDAQDNLIDFCQENQITGDQVISLSPSVMSEPTGYTVSLWLLLR